MSAGSQGEDDDRGSEEDVGDDEDGDREEPAAGREGGAGEEIVADAETAGASGTADGAAERTAGATEEEVEDLRAQVDSLRRDLESFEVDVEERTLHRSEIESELRGYVRSRVRRGHARGWGPYLVLLYGTAMTIGAFYLLTGGWAILAMIVVWLSTLGLYALMLIVGVTFGVLSLPVRGVRKLRR